MRPLRAEEQEKVRTYFDRAVSSLDFIHDFLLT